MYQTLTVDPRPALSPKNLLEMQTLRLHPRLSESETRVGPRNLCPDESSRDSLAQSTLRTLYYNATKPIKALALKTGCYWLEFPLLGIPRLMLWSVHLKLRTGPWQPAPCMKLARSVFLFPGRHPVWLPVPWRAPPSWEGRHKKCVYKESRGHEGCLKVHPPHWALAGSQNRVLGSVLSDGILQ